MLRYSRHNRRKGLLTEEQAGLTLLEMLLALGLLALIGTAMITALTTGTKATGTLDQEVDAAALLRSQLDAVRNTAYNTNNFCYPNCYAPSVTTPPEYTVTVTTAKVLNASSVELCVAGSNCLHKVTVTVLRKGSPVMSATTYKKN